MTIEAILPLIIGVIIFFMALKVLKSLIKTVFLMLGLLLVLGIIGGYFVVQDINDLKTHFFVDEKLMLLTENDHVVTGFTLGKFELNSIDFLSKDEVASADSAFQNGDYETLLDDRYRLLIFKKSMFAIENDSQDEEVFTNTTVDSGALFILKGFKDQDVIVYPETTLFKAIRYFILSTEKAKELISKK